MAGEQWYLAIGGHQVGPARQAHEIEFKIYGSEMQFVGGIKTALFGGEGLFFATLTGPGKVWLQSLPLSRLADRIYKAIPGLGRGGKEEGPAQRAGPISSLDPRPSSLVPNP
jgi:hypothetical protein